ncbi:FAD-dependent monooxygenase [Paraburkholderia nemoris]|uniref:FAD-dependent monooxygenase n=1 Tax=Paraburkholderia nemoris TaxID=2793076 RepID=UPI0038B6CE83
MYQTNVLVAGGGPVGMTLALILAKRGIRCTLVERNETTTAHPKMDITNARSMELFRGIDVASDLRKAAVAEGHCFDVSWISDFTGHELHRFRYPSVTEHRALIRAHNDGSQPSESPMRVSQVEIEPVLKRAIEAEPLIDVRFGVEIQDLRQDASGVTATVHDRRTADTSEIRCEYLVGCDGGGSRVRSCLGIELNGDARIMQRYMVHFRSDRRDLLLRWGNAWHYQSAFGTLIAQNDHDTWTLHSRLPTGVSLDAINPADQITRFVGTAIEHEVLQANPWSPHLLVADAYGRGRVFLVGDAAHQYIPTGGYGMNTGVGDAFDIGWKLAAVVHGFGGPKLLESYEIERRPVGLRNCDASRRHNNVRMRIGELYADDLSASGSIGDEKRANASARIAALGNAENESFGIEFGYAYRDSPVVANEPDAEWIDDPLMYRPSTAPGARLPSVFLDDGSSVYHSLGPWFTLLLSEKESTGNFYEVARSFAMPLRIVRLQERVMASTYRCSAVLVRPDHHIAWRGASTELVERAVEVISRSLGRQHANVTLA